MRPIGVRLPQEDLAANLRSRFEAMDDRGTQKKFNELLINQPKLREFLQQAIKHLESTNDAYSHTQIAHFLMGRNDKLPWQLSQWAQDNPDCRPTPELASMLDDLLRTNRYGLVKETKDKTLAKLRDFAAGMEKLVSSAAFGNGMTDSIGTDSVAQWMHDRKTNKWVPESTLGERRKGDYSAKLSVNDTKTIPRLNELTNIHIHIGKITDFRGDSGTRTAILLRSDPDMLLANGHESAKAVLHADGAEIQAELFRRHGLPLPAQNQHKYQPPPGIQTDDNGDFFMACDANDMKTSHSIEKIGVFGSTRVETAGQSNQSVQQLGLELTDMTHLILPLQDVTHDPYNAIALAKQNPDRHIILVIDSVDTQREAEIRASVLAETLMKAAQEVADPPVNVNNLA